LINGLNTMTITFLLTFSFSFSSIHSWIDTSAYLEVYFLHIYKFILYFAWYRLLVYCKWSLEKSTMVSMLKMCTRCT
jgi:hypothetical protein